MIITSLKISVSHKKQQEALQVVRAILGWTCAQPGCISMEFYQDTNDPDSMILLEEWKDWNSLERHIRSESYRNILELMELSSEQPEIKLSTVASTKGMEVIEKLRG
jgi:quinol monooxygenase YgiN